MIKLIKNYICLRKINFPLQVMIKDQQSLSVCIGFSSWIMINGKNISFKYFCPKIKIFLCVMYESHLSVPLALWLTAICFTSCDNFEKIFCLMQTLQSIKHQAFRNKRQSQETVRLRYADYENMELNKKKHFPFYAKCYR